MPFTVRQNADPLRPARTKLIITADDFGRSETINLAVLQAYRQGILTSASLMVTGEAANHAVHIARQNPGLAVGLHLTLVDGRPASKPADIPHLLDSTGRFPNSPLALGLRYFFHPQARKELHREILAQFQLFAASGLPLSHVDGHEHMHLHPMVFKLLVPLAVRFGARGLRIPRDELLLSLRCDSRRALGKILIAAAFAPLAQWCRRTLRGRLSTCRRTYGFMQSGEMSEPYVLSVLGKLKASSAEIYFHPTLGSRTDALGPNPGDLHALLSPAVRCLIQRRQLRLSTYAALEEC